ncbi:MAG: ABC transporter ATP-binding protein [Promethearchaeota archaeon]
MDKVKEKEQNGMILAKIRLKEFQSAQEESTIVLKNFNFEIHPGDFISIIGPSGCGKTTLLRILAGFDTDFEGSISLDSGSRSEGDDLDTLDGQRLGKIGYIPQEFSLFPWLTVEDNIRFGLNIKKMLKQEQDPIISRLLEAVKMTEFRNYYPKELSGGMKQKIAISRALAINPTSNLILMDEPFSALDAQTRNKLQLDLIDIWRQQNLTIVFVTHNIDEAVFLSNRILVMSHIPATIVHEEPIAFSHPRDRTSPEFNAIRRKLITFL